MSPKERAMRDDLERLRRMLKDYVPEPEAKEGIQLLKKINEELDRKR